MKDSFIPGEVGPLHVAMGGEMDSPPMLLVHGMAGNTSWWDACLPALAARYRVAALDFRGHGDSGWARPARYEIVDYAADIEAARAGLGWGKFHLVAHSMGAIASIEFAVRHPERLLSLTLVDFLTDFTPKASRKFRRPGQYPQPYYPTKEELVARFRLEPSATSLSPERKAAMAEKSVKKDPERGWTWKFDWQAFGATFVPVWPRIALVKAPTLIVRGSESDVMEKDSYERAVREVAGAKGVEVPGAFHHVPVDAPDTMSRLILEHAAAHAAR